MTVVWSWLKWEKSPCRVSLGWGGSLFPVGSHGEPLDGASRHGLLQERWLTANRDHDDGARAVPEGERLMPLNWLAMNSRLPKRMVSPSEKPSHGERSPPVDVMNTDDGTIRTV
jgi:hypothetical protein